MNKLPSREELIASGNEVAEKAWASVKTVPVQRNTGKIIPLGKRQLQVKVRELERQLSMMDAAMRFVRNTLRNANADTAAGNLCDPYQLELAIHALNLHIKDSR